MSKPVYTRRDLGCWIDGAGGQDHRRAKLRDMLEECFQVSDPAMQSDIQRIQRYLEDDMSDDASEEDEAIEIIQHHTEEGLIWEQDGDFCLREEEIEE